MAEFLEPYWNLEQTVGWAETRDPEAVRHAAVPKLGKPDDHCGCSTYFRQLANRLAQSGRDVDEWLWIESGWDKSNNARDRHWYQDWLDRFEARQTPSFPIVKYLEHLFRIGALTSIANRRGEPRAYALTKEDWAGLEINEGGELERLGVWRIGNVSVKGEGEFENVRVERDALLKLFPEAGGVPVTAPVPTAKPSKPAAAAEALKRLFPDGRPSMTRNELLRRLAHETPEIGSISLKTLGTAISKAWGVAE